MNQIPIYNIPTYDVVKAGFLHESSHYISTSLNYHIPAPGGKFGKKLSGCIAKEYHMMGRGVVGGPNLKTMTRVLIISHLAPATKTQLFCVHFFPFFFFLLFCIFLPTTRKNNDVIIWDGFYFYLFFYYSFLCIARL